MYKLTKPQKTDAIHTCALSAALTAIPPDACAAPTARRGVVTGVGTLVGVDAADDVNTPVTIQKRS